MVSVNLTVSVAGNYCERPISYHILPTWGGGASISCHSAEALGALLLRGASNKDFTVYFFLIFSFDYHDT